LSASKQHPQARPNKPVNYLRRDHADLVSYYYHTGLQLQPVLTALENLITFVTLRSNGVTDIISEAVDAENVLYDHIITAINTAANAYVPKRKKNFYKFWWDEEINLLKDESIESNKLWKAAGKPRNDPIFDKRQKCRARYRKRIRDSEKSVLQSYTNDLHDCLSRKKRP